MAAGVCGLRPTGHAHAKNVYICIIVYRWIIKIHKNPPLKETSVPISKVEFTSASFFFCSPILHDTRDQTNRKVLKETYFFFFIWGYYYNTFTCLNQFSCTAAVHPPLCLRCSVVAPVSLRPRSGRPSLL